MKPVESIAPLTDGCNGNERELRLTRCGQIALDRVLLYLRCLDFPAPQALELARRVFGEVEGNSAPGADPVARAMQALRRLLREQRPGVGEHPGQARPERSVPASPPVYRSRMVPEPLAPLRLRSQLAGLLNIWRRAPNRGRGKALG
ncbi:MAG: hypothetical protein P4L55_17580 [Syntrophobacteraceae bacterium]|nr:hypothetical protein [Syntrophobacteraceae bacterium]